MRNLFIIGILLVGASMAGWFQINREGDRTTIEINRSEIRADARKAIDKGRVFLDRREAQNADQQQFEGGQQGWPQEQVAQQPAGYGGQQGYQQYPAKQQQQSNTNYYPPQNQSYPGGNQYQNAQQNQYPVNQQYPAANQQYPPRR